MARWIGASHERRAEQFLREAGLSFVARNITYRGSEIDLIMQEHGTWVCVEVKYRRQGSHGVAAESISAAKIRRMGAALQRYLTEHNINPTMAAMRLDAVVIDDKRIEWIKNIGV
ncbi:MAG: YraN family protein [Alteromonadaceae bacterium]|nr:YraN family protein [Alteromonadaceae bacterium]